MHKDDFESLRRGLAQAQDFMRGERKGFVVHEPVDIKALRSAVKKTQAEFAATYHLPIGTVRDWEQGRSQPDAPARALLRLIEKAPDLVEKMLRA